MIVQDIIGFTGILVVLYGALIEVFGVIRTDLSLIVRQTQTLWGYNSEHYESLVEQRIRMVSGFIMIALGTVLQLAGKVIPLDFLNNRYLPYWAVIALWLFIIVLSTIVMRRRISYGVNYFLVPETAINLKAKLEKYQNANQKSKKEYEKYILEDVQELETMLKINVKYKSIEESQTAIADLFLAVEIYCKKNKVYKQFPVVEASGH